MKPSERLVARVRTVQRLAAKAKGPDIRSALNNARISLNNISSKFGRDTEKMDIKAAVEMFEDVKDQITSVMFTIGDATAKQHLTRTVLSEIEQGIDAAKSGDARGVGVSAIRAANFLEGAIEHLAQNPEGDEKKEILARDLAMLVPRYGDNEAIYQRAINTCKQLAEGEKPKAKAFYTELAKALEGSLQAQMDLSSAAAESYKILPKAR